MLHLDTAERLRRLGTRHALAVPAETPESLVESLVALHSTDPASMMLSALVRLRDPRVADVERALYDDRTITRVLAMRRTVFAVPTDLVPTYLSSTRQSVAGPEYRKLAKLVAASGIDDPDAWLEKAHATALEAFTRLDQFSSAELAQTDPLLATRIEIGAGTKYATHQSIVSRLLTLTSAEGHAVRARPAGSWASTNFRWSGMQNWLPDLPSAPTTDDAQAEIARRWLARFGPARPEDLRWWTGWTKTATAKALAGNRITEVTTDQGPAIVLADDLEPEAEPAPWVALLPALDPTTMGWKHRDWYLGPHAEQVFDNAGNAGPTVWKDGRIVGGWTIRDDGTVAFRLLTDVGAEAASAIETRAGEVESLLGGTVIKARARGWTALERDLRR